MKTLQILMPMGGLGQRFIDKGYDIPKPLIEVEGRAMFLHAVSSFDKYPGKKKYIFIVRQDAEDKFKLGTKIKKLVPEAKIFFLKNNTRGSVETCMLARSDIDPELPLIVMDCDFSFTSSEYFSKVSSMVEFSKFDGVLLSFNSDWDRYSYAQVDHNGNVVKTAEKKVISNNALAGAYSFGSGALFLDAADDLLKKQINKNMKEYFLSLLYNNLISQGKRIALAKIDNFNSFGTPEELENFLSNTKQKQNNS